MQKFKILIVMLTMLSSSIVSANIIDNLFILAHSGSLTIPKPVKNEKLEKVEEKNEVIVNSQLPDWYHNLQLPNDNRIIGYGNSRNYPEACNMARADISRQLSSTVKVTDTSYKNEVNGKYSSSFSSKIKVESERVTNQYIKELKMQRINGWYSVAFEYDGRDLFEKILEIPNIKKAEKINYLNLSNLGIRLKKSLGYDPELILEVYAPYYNITIGTKHFSIRQDEFNRMFNDIPNDEISIVPSSRSHGDQETIYLKVNTTKAGYLSVFYVGTTGEVGVVKSNVYSDGINSKTFEHSSLFKYRVDSKELYIAIFTDEKIEVDHLQFISSKNRLEGMSALNPLAPNMNLPLLIDIMKQYPTCTSTVTMLRFGYQIQ